MRRSRIVATCISVWPVPAGTTVQPSAFAPPSNIAPEGTKWYASVLRTRSPRTKPAARSARAVRHQSGPAPSGS
jgi:hypothetical protein